ncbi:MAG: methylated-DNA--[protein]-cysteine S-methyltransferase [Ahrensia sp.]|nr:methylated-DNA--[protein]-cysteine S-methyltransferase [Ahrensia sp.]
MPACAFSTPLGWVSLREQDGAINALNWKREGGDKTALLSRAGEQLSAYFAHELRTFDLPLRPSGGAFQQAVCDKMRAIPYGETRQYGEIAEELGSMPQPVGNACGGNSIAIIIPCHRVVGAAGLGGFSAPGGVETKIALLKHEGAYSLLL